MIVSIEIRVQSPDGMSTNVLAGANELIVPAVPQNGQVDVPGVWMQVEQVIGRLADDSKERALEQARAWAAVPFQP